MEFRRSFLCTLVSYSDAAAVTRNKQGKFRRIIHMPIIIVQLRSTQSFVFLGSFSE
jgi:hypothetical protein